MAKKVEKAETKAKAKKPAAKKVSLKMVVSPQDRENRIRHLAYMNWMQATGGHAVGDDQSRQFWLDAESQVDKGS